MTSITHAFVNPKADGGDTTITRPSDWNAEHTLVGIRTQLTTDTTFFLATTGSDSNDGLTAGTPWLTIPHAIDVLSKEYDFAGFDVTVDVANGTYNSASIILPKLVGAGSNGINFLGDTTTPSNVVIAFAAGKIYSLGGPWEWQFSGVKITNAAGNTFVDADGGWITLDRIEWGTGVGAHMFAHNGGRIYCLGLHTVSGAASDNHFSAQSGALIRHRGPTINHTVATAYAVSFIEATGAHCQVDGISFTGSSPTGKRYTLGSGGSFQTNTSSLTYFPGNTAGDNNGGIYNATLLADDAILDATTVSSSTTTGALIVAGGVGIGGAVFIGGTANVAGATTLAAPTTAAAGLNLTPGTLMTTPSDGAIEMDANCIYGTTDAGNRGVIPVQNIIFAQSNRTFTSNTSAQTIFNSPANGRLTLEAGTYRVKATLFINSMSTANPDNIGIDLIGAGTASVGSWRWIVYGADLNAGGTAAAITGSWTTTASVTAIITGTTSGQLVVVIDGTAVVDTGGTIIPMLTMATASASVLLRGSYMQFDRIGSNAVTSIGQWD